MFCGLQKKKFIPLLILIALIAIAFFGCSDSQGVTSLNACLSEFSELVADYKSTVSADKSKRAEWDAKITAINEKWTNIRNEFGSDITPQHMDKIVQQYEVLVGSLTKFRKSLGS